MTPWQIARQIRHLLLAQTWPDGDTERVFGDVMVTAATDEEAFGLVQHPYCLINVGDAPADRDHPGYYRQAMSCAVGVVVEGGQYGEEALIGGARGSGQGSSSGRGLLEIEEEFLKAVSLLTGADGVNATCSFASGVNAGIVQGLGYVAQRAYRIECAATSERYYHPPQDLAKSGTTVSWVLPPSRYDFWKVRLFKQSGATAPGYEEGTEVTISDPTADTSVTDSHSGETTYAIFAVYDETHTGTPDSDQRQSAAGVTGTTLTVT